MGIGRVRIGGDEQVRLVLIRWVGWAVWDFRWDGTGVRCWCLGVWGRMDGRAILAPRSGWGRTSTRYEVQTLDRPPLWDPCWWVSRASPFSRSVPGGVEAFGARGGGGRMTELEGGVGTAGVISAVCSGGGPTSTLATGLLFVILRLRASGKLCFRYWIGWSATRNGVSRGRTCTF